MNGKIRARTALINRQMPTSCTMAASTPAAIIARTYFPLVPFILNYKRVESDVSLNPATMKEFHQPRQIGLREIVRAHAGVKPLQSEINRIRAILNGGPGAFPIARWRKQFRKTSALIQPRAGTVLDQASAGLEISISKSA